MIGSAWQYNDYTYVGGGGAATSSFTTPTNGANLSAATFFQWQPVAGASEYWIDMSFSLNGTELYNASQGLSTSTTFEFTGFSGERLHMRLWTRSGGTWRYTSYTFFAPYSDARDGGATDTPTITSRLQSVSVQ